MTESGYLPETFHESKELLEAALKIRGDGVWAWDLKTRTLSFNPECYTMLGYIPNEFPATYKNYIARVHAEDRQLVKRVAQKHLSGETSEYSVEFRFLRKDGSYAWLHSQGRIVKCDSSGMPLKIMGIQSDITVKKELQGVVFRNSQLASIGKLAASVAHEINNPINGIINYAQLLLNSNALDEKSDGIVRRIKKESIRIEKIVRELLVGSGDTKNKKRDHDIKDIVVSALSILDVSYRKEGVSVAFNSSGRLPLVNCNFQQVEQVLINILRNAYQALAKNQIDNRKIIITSEMVNVSGEPYLQLTVANNGPAIPQEILGKIMEPFFSTKSDIEGTGLGLSISSDIMKEHGGGLLAHSEPGGLTEMILYFPVNPLGAGKETGNKKLGFLAERRSSARVEVEIIVFYGGCTSKLLASHGIDLSPNGVFLVTSSPFMIGENLFLKLHISGPEEKVVSCNARVAWINHEMIPSKPAFPAGVGLQFIDLNPEGQNTIVGFLKMKEGGGSLKTS